MTKYADILTEKKERHAIIQLNRPEKMNALSHNLRAEVFDALKNFEVDDDIKGGATPRDAKIDLAMELTTRFTSEKEAEKAKDNFFKKFSSNELPSDIEEKEISIMNRRFIFFTFKN